MPTSDDERYALLHRNYQDLAAGILRIREAVERAFDMTLPSATTTMSGQFEATVQAIYDAAADRPRRGRPPLPPTRNPGPPFSTAQTFGMTPARTSSNT